MVVMASQLLDLLFVASFCLREELPVEMLNLRDLFRNKSVDPANRSGEQLGLIRLAATGGWSLCELCFVACRCFATQCAIKFDDLCGDAGIDQRVDGNVRMTSSPRHGRSGMAHCGVWQMKKLRNSAEFRFGIFEKRIVMSNEPLFVSD